MTIELVRGANTVLDAASVTVSVYVGSAVDLVVWPLDATGRVSAAAVLTAANPVRPGVQVVAGPPQAYASVDVGQIEPAVDRLVVSAVLPAGGQVRRFGDLGGLGLAVHDNAGALLATLRLDDLGDETAVELVELYRRGADWKLRALGRGFSAGLQPLAARFGVALNDIPLPAPAPPQPPSAPPLRPPPATSAPIVASATAGAPVNLDKGVVSLAKRQTVSLTKTGAPPLRRVRMGLGWDPARAGRNIDLDASCILYDHGLRSVAKVWFGKKHTKDRSVTHSGDNLTGHGEGDDETIVVQLDAVPTDVLALLFTVNSYRKHPFTEVRNAFCRLIDDATDEELVRFDLTESEPRTGVYMCVVSRAGAAWQMTSIGVFRDGKTVNAMVDPGALLLRELGIG